MLDPRARAGLPSELDDAAHLGHLLHQALVALARLRPAGEEDGRGRVVRAERPPEVLREERHRGSDHAHRFDERAMQCVQRRAVTLPEAAARAADVPVGEVVDERLEAAHQVGRPRPLVGVGHLVHELSGAREQPAIERLQLARRLVRVEPLDPRVVDEELDGVPERQQPPFDVVRRPVAEVEVLTGVLRAEQPADRIISPGLAI